MAKFKFENSQVLSYPILKNLSGIILCSKNSQVDSPRTEKNICG